MTDFDSYAADIASRGLDAVLGDANARIAADREASILEREQMKAATALAQSTADEALATAQAAQSAADAALAAATA